MKDETELHKYWIEVIQTEGANLTKWESDFIDSLDEWIKSGRKLSEKQIEILERIYANKTPI